ncbi:MAG: hypothetical protein AAF738_07895 [Bacteroidota bacterium]
MRFKFYQNIRFVCVAIATITLYYFLFSPVQSKPSFAEESKNETPDEWFLHQRTYPYQTINTKAHKQAVKQLKDQVSKQQISSNNWKLVGPTNIGGRVTSIVLHPNNENIIFVGTATGGIFKTSNKGQSWQAVFDAYTTRLSIGALALAPSNPKVLYA